MHSTRHHGNSNEFAHHHNAKTPWWKQAHRDWRVWTGVVLMVVAMLVYVFSVDNSLQPGGVKAPQQAAP